MTRGSVRREAHAASFYTPMVVVRTSLLLFYTNHTSTNKGLMRLALVGARALSCGLQCAVSVISPGIIIIVHLDASNAVLYRHLFVSLARFPHIRALNTFAKYRLAA